MEIEIIRATQDPDQPQIGLFLIDKLPKFLTLEPAKTHPEFPCIPDGAYICEKVYNRMTPGGMHIPETFEVKHVIGREGILFHIGNSVKETHGCILLGADLINSQYIGASHIAFSQFVAIFLEMQEFKLQIKTA